MRMTAAKRKQLDSDWEDLRTHVLLAEDDDEMRRILSEALEDAGYRVSTVSDGMALLHRLELEGPESTWAPPFDVLVSDIRMPGLTGMEILAGLHAAELRFGVVLISAFADEPTRKEATDLGAVAVLSKPFPLQNLLDAVRAVAPSRWEGGKPGRGA